MKNNFFYAILVLLLSMGLAHETYAQTPKLEYFAMSAPFCDQNGQN